MVRGDGYVCYLDSDDGFMNLLIYPNYQVAHFKYVQLLRVNYASIERKIWRQESARCAPECIYIWQPFLLPITVIASR